MEEKSDCEHCRTWEEEMYWKYFNSLQFCQILPKNFHDHLIDLVVGSSYPQSPATIHLAIGMSSWTEFTMRAGVDLHCSTVLPEKFAAHMTTQMPDKVSLTGPSAIVWDVEILKTDNLLLVGNGWKDFVKAYDLKENCLLMFKYKRNLGFEVFIFDAESSCEKEAAYFVKKCRHTNSEVKKHTKRAVREASSTDVMEDDNEDHDSAFFVSKKSKKDFVEKAVCLGSEKNVDNPSNQTFNAAARGTDRWRRMVTSSNSPEETLATNEAIQEQSRYTTPLKHGESSPEKTSNGNDTARKVNPISVRDWSWSTPENRELSSEINHSDKCNSLSGKEPCEDGTATNPNQGSGRELIMVEYRERSRDPNYSQKSGMKQGRPKKQATPKSSRKWVSRTSVSAGNGYPKDDLPNRREVIEMQTNDAFRRANQERTEKSFIVVMRPTCVYRRFYMSIPSDWMNKHLPRQHQKIVLHVGDKSWQTMFYYNQKRRVGGLGAGWKKFALENSLKEYDALLFKFTKRNDDTSIVFDVGIFRATPKILPPLIVGSSTLT
ncbi:B3 domain-containing protein REM16 [Bienertia sinuspersici]